MALGITAPADGSHGHQLPVPRGSLERRPASTWTARAPDFIFFILFTVLPTAAPSLGHLLVTASVGAYGQGSIERRPRLPSVHMEDLGLSGRAWAANRGRFIRNLPTPKFPQVTSHQRGSRVTPRARLDSLRARATHATSDGNPRSWIEPGAIPIV